MSIGKLSKEELERLLEKGTLKEKVKVIVNDKSHRINNGGRGIISKANMKRLYDSVSDDEAYKFNEYLEYMDAVFAKRDNFLFYQNFILRFIDQIEYQKTEIERAMGYSILLGSFFLEMDDLLDDQRKEQLRKKVKADAELLGIPINTRWELLPLAPVVPHDGAVPDMMANFTHTYRLAKSIILNLENFLEKYNIKELLPYDIKGMIATIKKPKLNNKIYKKHVYKQMIDPESKGLFAEALLDDSTTIAAIIPRYEDVEPIEEVVNDNYFEPWNRQRKR